MILYGSQKGNAEFISSELESMFEKELNTKVYRNTLNSAENIFESENKPPFIFIICSTTGNGEAPDNAYQFWKKIKNRTIPKNTFEKIKYSVLALGDTNYSNFCGPGKFIDKRMKDLGAQCVVPLACADDATNAEEIIHKWLSEIIDFCNLNI